jgi:hypothetical protein
MSRGKTGLIVLTILAAMFFLFIAVLFGSSSKRQEVIDRKAALEEKLSAIAQMDITIYWIGEFPPELEVLAPVTQVIPPESASAENLPIKSTTFHTTERDEYGKIVKEDIPREYSRYMLIVVSGNPVLSDSGKEALNNAIAANGVPVYAIGDEASDLVGSILLYSRRKNGLGSSLFYSLSSRYKENPISEDIVQAGGMDLAEALPGIIDLAIAQYPTDERILPAGK